MVVLQHIVLRSWGLDSRHDSAGVVKREVLYVGGRDKAQRVTLVRQCASPVGWWCRRHCPVQTAQSCILTLDNVFSWTTQGKVVSTLGLIDCHRPYKKSWLM